MRLPRACAPRPGARGFTLIEIMVTLVIVTVLAAIALPAYQSSVRKTRRADAMDAAIGLQQAQEYYRGNNTSYAVTLADLYPSPQVPPTASASGYYGLALSAATATGYTLTFTGVNGKSQASDSGCSTLTVVVSNGSPTPNPTACWSK